MLIETISTKKQGDGGQLVFSGVNAHRWMSKTEKVPFEVVSLQCDPQ